ncbi:btk-binding protein-related [Anaeramoeba flamelloides]|uniref:Btk-binding protein-related n=1 Tax=Anaeramoeba flamelloides TaxID=1746091 RepID=A0AAV7YQ36_9EUKA|nr:btk-binding protein-related [Anaeramoeba flamelloides]
MENKNNIYVFEKDRSKLNFLITQNKIHDKWYPTKKIKEIQKVALSNSSDLLVLKQNNKLLMYTNSTKHKYQIDEQIKNIYSNRLIYFIVTESGKVFFLSSKTSHTVVPSEESCSGDIGFLNEIKFFTNKNILVDSMAMAGWTNYFLCKDQSLYGNGLNREGQLGNGTQQNEQMPVFLRKNVDRIFAGNSSRGMFYTQGIKLFSCGENSYYKFSTGKTNDNNHKYTSPVEITPSLEKYGINATHIKDLQTNGNTTIFITHEGKTYSCGDGIYNGHNKEVCSFTEIPKLMNKTAIHFGLAEYYAILLTEDNECYAWGKIKNSNSQNTGEPQKIELPKINLSLPLVVSCGTYSSVLYNTNYKTNLQADFRTFYKDQQLGEISIKSIGSHSTESLLHCFQILVETRTGTQIKQIEDLFKEKTFSEEETNAFLEWAFVDQITNKVSLNTVFESLNLNFPPENSLESDLLKLYKNESSKDFNILVKEDDDDDEEDEDGNEVDEDEGFEEIPVHKFILITRSGLYRDLFNNVNEKEKNMRQVKDFSGKSIESLEILIKYFYTNKIELTADDDPQLIAEELEDAVEYYQLSNNSNFNQELNKIKRGFI